MAPTPYLRHRRLRRLLTRYIRPLLVLTTLTFLEIYLHAHSLSIPRPTHPLDPPFASSCKPRDAPHPFNPASNTAPPDASYPGENATILMLARNSDLTGAVTAVRSLERAWNKWFHYPYVFLNDQPFSSAFIAALEKETSGAAVFAQVPREMWSWPTDASGASMLDQDAARAAMRKMEARGLPYAANENYHHMCRFYSGFFFDVPELQGYQWYWRLEPDVEYTCAVPYDPFRQMRAQGKRYGYVMALWEVGSTAPSLFRTVTEHMERRGIKAGTMWRSGIEASTAPAPVRWWFMSWEWLFHSRTRDGDPWSLCHFWSNFEIADMEFFRSEEYRELFRALDESGGFYTERWGDAPVHSLAAMMLLEPEELHWFADFGYVHPPLQHCPEEHAERGLGCGCECGVERLGVRGVPEMCLRSLRRAVEPG